MSDHADKPTHGTRLYLRRRGRVTRGQARALGELGPRYRLDPQRGVVDPVAAFGRAAPLGLEIGFGMGHALIDWALTRPDWNLLGIEVYQPGIGSALLGLERHGIGNVRLLEADAERALEASIGPHALDEVRIFFPDPWPKTRHHKRRLIQPRFVTLLARRMRPDGLLWVATDWAEYADWIVAVMDAEPELIREPAPPEAADEPSDAAAAPRPRSRFEARGRRLGHAVRDLRYRRKR